MRKQDDPNYCPMEPTEHRHWWVEPAGRDETRAIEIDPMVGVEVYVDTGDPVFPFPYTGPSGSMCRWCGRTR